MKKLPSVRTREQWDKSYGSPVQSYTRDSLAQAAMRLLGEAIMHGRAGRTHTPEPMEE